MAAVSVQSSLKVSDDVVFRELDGEAVVLNLASGIYFGLDRVGTRMWQLIDEHGALARVVSTMRDEFDAPPDLIERDLLRLVSDLVEKGLLVTRDEAADV